MKRVKNPADKVVHVQSGKMTLLCEPREVTSVVRSFIVNSSCPTCHKSIVCRRRGAYPWNASTVAVNFDLCAYATATEVMRVLAPGGTYQLIGLAFPTVVVSTYMPWISSLLTVLILPRSAKRSRFAALFGCI